LQNDPELTEKRANRCDLDEPVTGFIRKRKIRQRRASCITSIDTAQARKVSCKVVAVMESSSDWIFAWRD
jgi:hypothetical protein